MTGQFFLYLICLEKINLYTFGEQVSETQSTVVKNMKSWYCYLTQARATSRTWFHYLVKIVYFWYEWYITIDRTWTISEGILDTIFAEKKQAR